MRKKLPLLVSVAAVVATIVVTTAASKSEAVIDRANKIIDQIPQRTLRGRRRLILKSWLSETFLLGTRCEQ